MSNRKGCRGYIGSRRYRGDRAPQHVQNLVIRDYCQRRGLTYLLSATEYAMPGCYTILEDVVRESPTLDGVVLYSIFMLPEKAARRLEFCRRILDAGATIHGAVENLAISNEADLQKLDELMMLETIAGKIPPGL
jgi:sporadic carbohydrate cluster protein (TIGR04323 family)